MGRELFTMEVSAFCQGCTYRATTGKKEGVKENIFCRILKVSSIVPPMATSLCQIDPISMTTSPFNRASKIRPICQKNT